jgi:hypothetical protein
VDWVTISSLATAAGTLVLAVATYASVRSANRAARVAEQSLLAQVRPLLMTSHWDDPVQKVGFMDEKWLRVEGGRAVAEAASDAVYLAISVRNAGSGIAVMHGWRLWPDARIGDVEMPPLETFIRLTRDLYVAAGDCGFWQGTFRDPGSEEFVAARRAIESRTRMAVDVLYSDELGGQRVITRFGLAPRDDTGWIAGVSHHWHVDSQAPR